jgi:hypothetical protein
MKFSNVRPCLDGLTDEPNAVGRILLLEMQHPQQMQRIRLVWQARQNLSIPFCRLAQTSRLVMRDGLFKDAMG